MKKINWKQVGIGFLLIFLFYLVLPNVVVLLYGIFFPLDQPQHVIIATLLSYLIMLLFFLFFYKESLKKDIKTYFQNFKHFFKVSFLTWCKALLFMMITNLIIISIAGDIAQNESTNRSIISMFPVFSCITMIGLGPFMEELLFRKGFKDAFPNETIFCIFTAFLFGFAHVSGILDFSSVQAFIDSIPQLLFIIPYGGIGYFFARAYCETNTIFTSTVTHMMHNAFAVLVSMIGVS